MNQLRCPFCGPRELHEYEFRKTRESVQTSQYARVYLRVDSPDLSTEYWQHVLGCRAWLLIRRNPSTGMILDTTALPGDCL
jgi:methylglutamate dehydrogenase subunit B